MDIISEASAVQLRDFYHDSFARELIRLHEIYFGETTYTPKQVIAVATARRTNKSLTAIRSLEAKLTGLKELDRWIIREELLAMDIDENQLASLAGKRVEALKAKPVKQHGVTIRRSKEGPFQIAITGDSDDITDMKHAFGDTIESAKEFFFKGEKAARPVKQTNVIITLDELAEVIHGEGRETLFRMTNGAIIPGAQLDRIHGRII